MSLLQFILIANINYRRRFFPQRDCLQFQPRQNLHQTPPIKGRERNTRVPPSSRHIQRLCTPAFGYSLRLDRRPATPSTFTSRIRRTPGLRTTAQHHPSPSLCCRFKWALLSICVDWYHCHEMSGRHFLAAGYWPFDGSVWIWMGIHVLWCAEHEYCNHSHTCL
jgi:hypothetical protein